MITDILKENNKVLEIILNTENEPRIDNLINNQIELNNNAISLVQDELLSDVIVPKGTVCDCGEERVKVSATKAKYCAGCGKDR